MKKRFRDTKIINKQVEYEHHTYYTKISILIETDHSDIFRIHLWKDLFYLICKGEQFTKVYSVYGHVDNKKNLINRLKNKMPSDAFAWKRFVSGKEMRSIFKKYESFLKRYMNDSLYYEGL